MLHTPQFLKLVNDAKSRVKEITVHEAYTEAKKPGVYLVDVREESEWHAGHAPGATHLGKGIIERHRRAHSGYSGADRLLLRRRFSFRSRGRQSPKNGLHERRLCRWWFPR